MEGAALFKAPIIVYGTGTSRKAGEYAHSFGRRALIVTETHLDKMGI